MTLPDLPDFAASVSLIETVSVLGPPGGVIDSNGASVDVDTSKIVSVTLAFDPQPGAAGDRYVLAAQWMDGFDVTDTQSLSTHNAASFTDHGPPIYWQLPVRGTTLRLSLIGTASGNRLLSVIGSTREVSGVALSNSGGGSGRLLLDTGNIVIAANTAATPFAVPPVSRALRYIQGFRNASLAARANGVRVAGGVIGTSLVLSDFATAVQPSFGMVELAGVGTEWGIQNVSAGAITGSLQVWDVS